MLPGDFDAITLSGLSFHVLIGVLPHERELPQPIEIDLTAWVVPGGGIVDYRRLYADVRASMDSPKLLYLEEVADSIAARVLGNASVQRVRVVIRKPQASIGGPLKFAEVSIVRLRDA